MAYCAFLENNPGHFSQDRGSRLNQVDAGGLGGTFNFPLLDHRVQTHQILVGGEGGRLEGT